MNDEGERVRVGVVGDASAVVDAVVAAGGEPSTGTVEEVRATSPDAIVAVGETALVDVATAEPTPAVPVLPVEAGAGTRSVPVDELEDALDRLLAGDGRQMSVPVLEITVGDEQRARALLDVTLVTVDPARISEYSVTADGTRVSQFRADGLVVATPTGSHGYARAVEAPVVSSDTGVVAVAPIAPFATDVDNWVLGDRRVTLRVERDTAAVELLADGRPVGTVPPATRVVVSHAGSVTMAVLPESKPPFRA